MLLGTPFGHSELEEAAHSGLRTAVGLDGAVLPLAGQAEPSPVAQIVFGSSRDPGSNTLVFSRGRQCARPETAIELSQGDPVEGGAFAIDASHPRWACLLLTVAPIASTCPLTHQVHFFFDQAPGEPMDPRITEFLRAKAMAAFFSRPRPMVRAQLEKLS